MIYKKKGTLPNTQKKLTALPFNFSAFAKNKKAPPNVTNKNESEGGYLLRFKNENIVCVKFS